MYFTMIRMFNFKSHQNCTSFPMLNTIYHILGDPGADSGAEDELKAKWVGKKLTSKSMKALLLVEFFPACFDFVFSPTICPWVFEDEFTSISADYRDFEGFLGFKSA